MAVYVDNYSDLTGRNFGRMKMSHMVADTKEELLQMCDKIGVQRKWIQYEGDYKEHFDICLSKKKKAIEFGAIQLDARELVEFCNKRKLKTNEAEV